MFVCGVVWVFGFGFVILLLVFLFEIVVFCIFSGILEVEEVGCEYFCGCIWGVFVVLFNFVLVGWFFGCE